MSCALAIFTEIGSNLRRCEEQQSWRPHGPMPSSTRVVSRAPIWRISMRARYSRARSRTRSRRSEEHTSDLQSRRHLVCRLLLEQRTLAAQQLADATKHPPERAARVTATD